MDTPGRSTSLAEPVDCRCSVAKCGEIYTLLKEHLDEILGTLAVDHMKAVDRALATALDLRTG